jgi:hypothetical protein
VKLGEQGDQEVGVMPKGVLRSARKPRKRELVAARVVKFLACDECAPTCGVQPLNAGFFTLERMRATRTARAKGKAAKVRGR